MSERNNVSRFKSTAVLMVMLLVLLPGCEAVLALLEPEPAALPTAMSLPTPVEPTALPPVQVLVPEIISTRPHDATAFTQGFLLTDDGRLFESTGLNGQSSVREVNPQTGEVLRIQPVAEEYFAEGLALVGDRLIQLTWQSGVAFVYDRDSFELLETYSYNTEGWGLCYDAASDQLYMSDGSHLLYVRDPETFELRMTIPVLLDGDPVTMLNELECVDDAVYANVWQTDAIVEIDKATGRIRSVIDARALLTPDERASLTSSNAVLNGIAYDPQTGNFLITGKLYPVMWEVQFVPVGE